MSRPSVVEIDLGALHHNVKRIREIAPHTKLLAMIKANAYGHGLLTIARALDQVVEGLGVACSEEALRLRHAGIKGRIVLMAGLFSASELPLLESYQLDTVIHDRRQIDLLTQRSVATPVNVWININTGFNQLGLPSKDFYDIWQQLQTCSQFNIISVMTHFQSAYKPADASNERQIKQFEQVLQGVTVEKSLANSAAILTRSDCHADWIRPGLMLYGVSPFSDSSGVQYGLKPVMHLKSEIMAINPLRAGDRVGYGGTWSAPTDRRVGIVAMGYGDGYPHCAQQGTPVVVNEQLVELIGPVSMDLLTVDLYSQPDAKQGDPVILWGSHLPVEQVEQSTSTFRYELLCGINRGALARVRVEEKNDVANDH